MKLNRTLIMLPLLILMIALCAACTNETKIPQTADHPIESDNIAIMTPEPNLHKEELEAILNRSTMLEGVTINGVAVGGMTPAEAKKAVESSVEALKKAYSVSVKIGDAVIPFSADAVETTDNLDAAVEEAFHMIREGDDYEAVFAQIEEIRKSGKDIPVAVSFSETSLKTAVDAFAAEHDVAPVNASVSYNKEENKIDFTPEVNGIQIDRDALVAALLAAANGDTVEAAVTETPAEETLEAVQSHFVLRGTQTTDYHDSAKGRKENIRHGAMDLLTGTILHPGEEFSMNKCLGVRKNDGHWKLAGAYQSGDTVQEYGGGVCQISTTLYNAALKADMKITDRRNHSMPVHYIAMGLDATINSVGNIIDFKFVNSSKADILIIANADGKNLTVEIWGIPISEDCDGKYDEIRIPKTKRLKVLKPSGEAEVRVDQSKPAGYRKESSKRRDGSIWQSYIEYYKNGELVERKDLATSTYKAFSGEIIVGPDASETPAPSDNPTKEPDTTEPPTKEPDPTEAPTNAPDPTEAPTNAPDPTEAPTKEPDPTEAPTKEPDPTEAPTKEPDPTEAPTKAPDPTEAPTKAPDPTDAPADNGEGNDNTQE